MMTYPMVNNNWTQYFEDLPNGSDPYNNKDQYSAARPHDISSSVPISIQTGKRMFKV